MTNKPWFEQSYQKITVTGFDALGEPHIRLLEGGGLVVMFNFMPPINADTDEFADDPVFQTFDHALSKVAGAEVFWEDREIFLVPNPLPDSAQRIKHYLEHFWTK